MGQIIPDTNVIIDNPGILDEDVVIPYCILNELDSFKKDKRIGYKVREVVRKIMKQNIQCKDFNKINSDVSVDNEILRIATKYDYKVITQDYLMYQKGLARGIDIELYQIDDQIYSGIIKDNLTPEEINTLYDDGRVQTVREMYENQFIMNDDVLARYFDGCLYKVDWNKRVNGIEKPTKRQLLALDVLFNKDIDLVSLFGPAGAGKTTLALNSAISQVMSGDYNKIILSRPKKQRNIDDGFGFLPGEIDNKYKPFNAPFQDNLYTQTTLDLQTLPLSSIQGRNLSNAIWIITEFQDIHPDDTKMVIGRAGQGTKVIIEGDIEQNSDAQLNKKYNGLTYVANRLKDSLLTATVELTENKRSPLSKLATDRL